MWVIPSGLGCLTKWTDLCQRLWDRTYMQDLLRTSPRYSQSFWIRLDFLMFDWIFFYNLYIIYVVVWQISLTLPVLETVCVNFWCKSFNRIHRMHRILHFRFVVHSPHTSLATLGPCRPRTYREVFCIAFGNRAGTLIDGFIFTNGFFACTLAV